MKICKLIGTYVLVGASTALGAMLLRKTVDVATNQGDRNYIKLYFNNLKHIIRKED